MNDGHNLPSEPKSFDSGLPAVSGQKHPSSMASNVLPGTRSEAGDKGVSSLAADQLNSRPIDDQAAVAPGTRAKTIFEIRVHGVSGTPPQDVLCSQWAEQVAGDAQAPIFQPADQFGHTTLGPDLDVDGYRFTRQTESYHWGEMTSGGWRKAIWAILLPFALINVSQWMLPPEKSWEGGRIQLEPIKAVLRLSGFLLTCLFMAQAAVLVMDVIVVQCSNTPGTCLPSVKLGWLWTHHQVLSILGALVLIALLAIINQTALVRWKPVYRDKGKPAAETGGSVGLIGDDSFYGGDIDAPWLRVVHLTGGLSIVVVLLLGGFFHPQPGWWWIMWAAAVVSLVGSGLAAVLLSDPRRPRPDRGRKKALMWAVPCIPMGMLIVTSATGPTASAGPGQSIPLQGSDNVVALVMAALSVFTLIFAVLLIYVRIRHKVPKMPKVYKPFIFGLFAIPVAALGTLLGAGLGIGYTEIVATCLTNKCNPTAFVHVSASTAPLKLPAFYGSISALWAVTAVAAAAGVFGLVLWFLGKAVCAIWWTPPSLAAGMVMQIPASLGQRFGVALSWQLARWRLLAARAVTILSLVMSAAGLLCLEALWTVGGRPESLNPERFLLDQQFLAKTASALGLDSYYVSLGNWGVIVLLLVTFYLLTTVYNAARRPDSARSLGILWDLASYWPRAAHPFVPPCYAQKAVPELVERAHKYIHDGHDVVLSAHSQGSLLTIAAALRMKVLHEKSCERLGLVMAGSQLQWAYPRAFPAVINYLSYGDVLKDLGGRWHVLVRGTDPLGGPVLSWEIAADANELKAKGFGAGSSGDRNPLLISAGVGVGVGAGAGPWVLGHDRWISDPMIGTPRKTGEKLEPFSLSAQRHSGYWSHPDWDEAVQLAAASAVQISKSR